MVINSDYILIISSRLDLGATLEGSRWLYNYLLSRNLRSRDDMQFALTELKENESWLKLYHSKMLQMILHQIDSARRSLIEKKKKRHAVGQLKYANKDMNGTLLYTTNLDLRIDKRRNTDRLWLSKIGWMEIRLHKLIDGKIKQVTITKRVGRWYAIIAVETKPSLPKLIALKKSVGIDVGIKNYAYDSDGKATPNPKNLQKILKTLTRTQRKMSRRIKGSCNYKKAKQWYKIMHERITNRRRDFQHKLSTYYARNYDVVFIEKLRITNMIKNHNLAQKIMDAGWASFKNMIDYKCMVIDVEPRNTTVDCSRCGHKVPKTLAIRIHHCDQCGLLIDRDHNASLNILKRGLELWNLPMEHREVTPVEISEIEETGRNLSEWIGSSLLAGCKKRPVILKLVHSIYPKRGLF